MSYRSFSLIPTFNDNLISDRFTQMDNLFSKLTGEKPISDIPAYNLLKRNKDDYELVISVPGFNEDELDISMMNSQITITGKENIKDDTSSKEKDNIKWLYQGIRKNSFSLSFNLDHKINIKNALLENGLLKLQFSYEIPEESKPKKINILKNNTDRISENK